MRIFLLCLFIASSSFVKAQDLTGIWRGNFNQSNYLRDAAGSRYKFEVQIDQNRSLFQAVTYSYLSTVFYGKATAKGTINPKSQKVYLEELKIVDVRMSGFSSACIMTCFLQYSKEGKEEFLEGTYFSMNTADSSNCGRGTVFLRKVSTSDFYKEPFLVKREKESSSGSASLNGTQEKNKDRLKSNNTADIASGPSAKRPMNQRGVVDKKKALKDSAYGSDVSKKELDEPAVASSTSDDSNASHLEIHNRQAEDITLQGKWRNRVNELAKTIPASGGKLEISIFDNGTIDNDTISVFVNDRLTVNKQRLTNKPIQFNIEFEDDQEVLELTLVAENLGDVPPNTSLMIVRDGNKTHELKLISNESKNALVRFRRS